MYPATFQGNLISGLCSRLSRFFIVVSVYFSALYVNVLTVADLLNLMSIPPTPFSYSALSLSSPMCG
jgi:hypothetical protein